MPMKKPLSALIVASFLLTSCGPSYPDSWINPSNWLGGPKEPRDDGEASVNSNPLIPNTRRTRRNTPAPYLGTPIQTVTSLKVDDVPGGAIIHATGVARMQGGHLANLTPATEDALPVDGVLTFRFEIVLPARARAVGPERSRKIVVARHLSDHDLANVRSIRVEGVTNAQVSRR